MIFFSSFLPIYVPCCAENTLEKKWILWSQVLPQRDEAQIFHPFLIIWLNSVVFSKLCWSLASLHLKLQHLCKNAILRGFFSHKYYHSVPFLFMTPSQIQETEFNLFAWLHRIWRTVTSYSKQICEWTILYILKTWQQTDSQSKHGDFTSLGEMSWCQTGQSTPITTKFNVLSLQATLSRYMDFETVTSVSLTRCVCLRGCICITVSFCLQQEWGHDKQMITISDMVKYQFWIFTPSLF